MSRIVEVAAVQLAAVPGAVERNLARFAELVRDGASGADLVVAPELLSSGYDLCVFAARGAELAESLDGRTVTLATRLAGELGCTIVVGLLERGGGALYDTVAVAVVGAGGVVASYRKTHLYPTEQAHFVPGDRLATVATPVGRLGPMICFEHAFPDVATALALEGAQLLVIPSAVPYGYEHLLTLRTRARAQDNQLYAIAANLAGDVFCGGSLIVDPRGDVLAQAGTGDEVVRAAVDLDEIEREREREPALALRRPHLYTSDPPSRPEGPKRRNNGSR